MAPRDPISGQFRRVHLDGDKAPPRRSARYDETRARALGTKVASVVIGMLTIAAIACAVLA